MKHYVKSVFVVLASAVMVLVVVVLWLARPLSSSSIPRNALSARYLIAHAGGCINGKVYTNSKEAVINAIDNRFRYIEMDLYMPPEGDVVCSHDSLTCQLAPVMSLREAVNIWNDKPFEFVVDKISDPQILNQYFKTNRAHVYVETFNTDEYWQLKRDGYVPMLSVGGMRGLLKYVATSIRNGKVDRIVTHYQTPDYMLRIYKRLGAKIAVYTVNDIAYLKEHIGKDVDMVYTDYIIPSTD